MQITAIIQIKIPAISIDFTLSPLIQYEINAIQNGLSYNMILAMKIGMNGNEQLKNTNAMFPKTIRAVNFRLMYLSFSEIITLKGFMPVLSKSIEALMKVKQDRPNQYTNIDIPSNATYL